MTYPQFCGSVPFDRELCLKRLVSKDLLHGRAHPNSRCAHRTTFLSLPLLIGHLHQHLEKETHYESPQYNVLSAPQLWDSHLPAVDDFSKPLGAAAENHAC